MSSKKVFMETLLTPTPNTIEKVFNSDKAAELFMEGHRDILVEVSMILKLLKSVHIHDDLKIMMWWLYMYYSV